MAQIQSPSNYVNGDQVTASNLNNHVNGAILLPGAVTDQTALTVNTVATGDSVLLYDLSVTALRKATASDLLNSGIALTTGLISGSAGADIVINPATTFKLDVTGPVKVDSLEVDAAATITGTTTLVGNLITNGAVSSSTGTNTFTGNVIVDSAFTSNGTANFIGQLQVNGSTAYALYEVLEETIAKFTATNNSQLYTVHTTASFSKPSDEIWVVEVQFMTMSGASSGACHWRLTNSGDTTNYAVSQFLHPSNNRGLSHFASFVIASGTSYSGTFLLRAYNIIANVIFGPESTDFSAAGLPAHGSINKFRIYKYKTA